MPNRCMRSCGGLSRRALMTGAGALAAATLAPGSVRAASRESAVLFSGVTDDGSFNGLALKAVRTAEQQFGIPIRQRFAVSEAEVRHFVEAFASRGLSHIVLLGANYAPILEAIADRYPKARFTLLDAEVERENVRSIVFREEEGAYLAGVAGALAAGSGPLGFIGGMKVPPILRFACGFRQGAEAVRPGAQVLTRYLSSGVDGFNDRAKAAEAARVLVSEGCEVVFVASGYAGVGALAVLAGAGRYGIGVDTNQNGLFPGRVLTSIVKRVDVVVEEALVDGNAELWTPGTVRLGLAQGAMDWAVDANNAALVDSFAARVASIRAELAEGRRSVEAGGSDCGTQRPARSPLPGKQARVLPG